MYLRPAAILVLFLLLVHGGELLAQEPPVQDERTHVVRAGETLSQIARLYYDAASAWTRIFEANRERVQDPHRIQAGLELRIPGIGGGELRAVDPEVRITEVTVMVADTPQRPVPLVDAGFQERRLLLRMRPFRPTSPPNPVVERSVFYGLHQPVARESTRPGVMLAPPEEVLAVPRSIFHGAAWIEGSGDDSPALGRVAAFEGAGALRIARTTLQPSDLVEVTLADGHDLLVGDRLLGYLRGDRVWRLGRIMVPTGVLLVQEVEANRAVARVETGFARFELGHFVTRLRPFPLEPGQHPAPDAAGISTEILAFAERREIYLPGDQAFIPLGAADGIRVGDRLEGIAGEREGWDGRRVATFQVIRAGENISTVRITGIEAPTAVRRGLGVKFTARMP